MRFQENENITIEGGGTIDGSGERWWIPAEEARQKKSGYTLPRPNLIVLTRVKNLTLRDVTIQKRITGAIHDSHRAFADLFDDLILADLGDLIRQRVLIKGGEGGGRRGENEPPMRNIGVARRLATTKSCTCPASRV